MRYTQKQLETLYKLTSNIDEIEQMAFGEYIALNDIQLNRLKLSYNIVFLYDDVYTVHLIPKK